MQKNTTVLDIGGQLNQLEKFCEAQKVTVANLKGSEEASDIKINKGSLPFKNNLFSITCAIDVLEHTPKKQRKEFIEELFRVCNKRAILSFPIGTENHINYEKQIEKYLKNKDHDVSYLKEHIDLGLPTTEEIKKYLRDYKYKLLFSGNLKINEILFKIFIFDPKIPILRRIIFLSKLTFNFLTNPLLYAILSNKSYSQNVVRAYLVIEK